MTDPLLEVDGVSAGYESNVVLRDVSLDVDEGEVVSIVGRNGAGKTTTLRTIMGQLTVDSGHVRFRGEDITNAAPNEVYRRGIGLVPEHREIFPDLTVAENLEVGGVTTDDNWLSMDEAYDYFPRLRERRSNRGAQLSGGEQQMLAIARSLRGATDLLLLDEPTEGLAPRSSSPSSTSSTSCALTASLSCWLSRTCRRCSRLRTATTYWQTAASSSKARLRN